MAAAHGPEQDFAVSWAAFVLTPQPTALGKAQQKIRFFYSDPSLVSLRLTLLRKVGVTFSEADR